MPPSGPDQNSRRPEGRGQRPSSNRRGPPRGSGGFASARHSHVRSSDGAEQSVRSQKGRASSSHVKDGLLSSPDQGVSEVLQLQAVTPRQGFLKGGENSSQEHRLRASAPEFVPGRSALVSGMGQPVNSAEATERAAAQHSLDPDEVSANDRDDEVASSSGFAGRENHMALKERGASTKDSESVGSSLKAKEDLWKGMEAGSLSKKEGLEARAGESASTSSSGADVLKVDEPVLSDEEKESNEQEQQDEVMVLESIFATDFVETGTEPRTFALSVHVSLPASHVEILGRLSDAAASGSGSDSPSEIENENVPSEADESGDSVEGESAAASSRSDAGKEAPSGQIRLVKSWQGGRLLSLTLEHLPPLRITCTLPAAYPSHAPPKFTLSSVWLTQNQLGTLCKGLDGIWEENQGQVVLYSWADWLGRETFETLGLGTSFEIAKSDQVEVGKGKGKEESGRDERAKAEGWGVQDVLPRLLRYNEEKTMEEFRKGVHECQVCFSEQPGAEFVHLWPGCRHNFCRGCMTALVDIHVKEGSLAQLTCPQPDCKEPLPPNVIKDLLEPAQFERWETLMLQRTFDSMTDVVYCPRCETPTIEEADHTAQCQKCFFAFCSLCDDATHFGSQCMDAEAQLAILRERTRGRLPAEEQKRKEAALLNEILNMKYVDREARKCPQCGMAIQKDEGCNKMTCANCNAYFCYKCGKAIAGYDHFNSGTCVLFEAAEIDAWNLMMAGVHGERNEARDLVDARAQLFPNRVRACPACRQPNVKEAGNNHLRCWSCQNHFCGACGKHVLKGSHHFGPKGCKQHTPD